MEAAMDRVVTALKHSAPLSASIRADIEMLEDYYASDWIDDFHADEEGLLPVGLKRGVLSEDALYDLLCEADERLAPVLLY